MPNVLVTGVNGFVGQHISKELSDNGITVLGVGGYHGVSEKPSHVSEYIKLDLTKPEEAHKIDFTGVNGVIHLAGLAAVGPSFEEPMRYITTNIGIEANLFEAALQQKATPRFLIVSSGNLYDSQAPTPFTESSPVKPSSPYAISKIGQEQMAVYYHGRGFESIIARPFNHIGPGQGLGFIVPDLAKQVVSYKKGLAKEVTVGNLEAKRDYTDVRDIARAYRLLLEKGKSGEIYNVCSGNPLSGHEILSNIMRAADAEPPIKEDPSLIRPSDIPVLSGNHDKISQDTGWQPEIDLGQTLADVVAEWQTLA